MTNYSLAPQGVFATVQGEGMLLGLPTVFVRFAGCHRNCPQCDTDYTFARDVTRDDLVYEIVRAAGEHSKWVWLTGGEPMMRAGVGELVLALRGRGFRVAMATAGDHAADRSGWDITGGTYTTGIDFLSVSPHGKPADLAVTGGHQMNIVPGLDGLKLADWDAYVPTQFANAFVTPMCAKDVPAAVEFVRRNTGFRLGVQAHKRWNLA